LGFIVATPKKLMVCQGPAELQLAFSSPFVSTIGRNLGMGNDRDRQKY